MIKRILELPSRIDMDDAPALAREILAACGETATLPPRGRNLADVQPCGCRVRADGMGMRYVWAGCSKHGYNAIPLAEDPNAVWEGEAAPVERECGIPVCKLTASFCGVHSIAGVQSREAVVRECAEWLANDGRPILAVNMLAALLPGVKP